MNYKIIKDKQLLLDFIDWLPETKEYETYYVGLYARTKYCKNEDGSNKFPHIQTDKAQLKRLLSKKEFLYNKIWQLECEVGAYESRGFPIPQEALAIYITPNPRDMQKAAKQGLRVLADRITEPYNGYNPQQLVMSEVHKSVGRKIWLDFDFDGVSWEELSPQLDNVINRDCLKVLKTRGGLHLLIESSKIGKEYQKTWYKNIVKISGIDVKDSSGSQIPIPGCTQGEFVPYFIV